MTKFVQRHPKGIAFTLFDCLMGVTHLCIELTVVPLLVTLILALTPPLKPVCQHSLLQVQQKVESTCCRSCCSRPRRGSPAPRHAPGRNMWGRKAPAGPKWGSGICVIRSGGNQVPNHPLIERMTCPTGSGNKIHAELW